MTTRRRSVLVALCAVPPLALAGCTGSPESPGPRAVASSAPAPAAPAPAVGTCKDGRPDVASLAPGGITLKAASWPADSAMAKIKRRGHLIVGTSGDARLWGARNPVNGKIEGYDVAAAARVATALGLDPADTVYKVLTIAQRLPALQAGTVDIVAERMTITCDRWQGTAKTPTAYINLSTPYYVSGARLLVRSDSKVTSPEQLAALGQSVCGVEASTSLDALESSLAKLGAATAAKVTRLVVSEPGRCLVKFQEGEADAVVGDDTTLAGLASQDQYAEIVGTRMNSSAVGFGLSAEAPEFTRFVNVVLEQMRADGSLTDLYNTWMEPTVDEPAPPVPQAVYGRDVTALQRQS